MAKANLTCSVSDCMSRATAHSWCGKHYMRFKRTGDPLGLKVRASVAERFESMWDEDQSGCWIWNRAVNHGGYGFFWDGDKVHLAHRYSVISQGIDIPFGYHVDHLCRTRRCVNPDHLEPVTPQENQARMIAAYHADNPKCPHGHDKTEANTFVVDGRWRRCRPCAEFSDKRPRRSRREMK